MTGKIRLDPLPAQEPEVFDCKCIVCDSEYQEHDWYHHPGLPQICNECLFGHRGRCGGYGFNSIAWHDWLIGGSPDSQRHYVYDRLSFALSLLEHEIKYGSPC